MTLLNAILLPFQAGYESIITAAGNPRELSVIERTFKDKHYKYTLESNISLLSWQGRISMFIKGITLCLPFIGHITSIALCYFSSSIFPEMPLDFAIKCSPEQKLEVAKCIYADRPEAINEATRIALADILVSNEEGFHLVIDHIGYINLASDAAFTQKIIQQKLAALSQIEDSDFSEQILNFLEKCPDAQKLIITKCIYTDRLEDVNEATRIALANILADDAEGFHLVIDHIGYINLTSDPAFTQKIIQQKPAVLDQLKGYLAKQILKKDPTDSKFILDFLNSLNFSEDSQQKVIKELILQTKGFELSHKMQAAINHVVLQNRTNDIFIQQLLRAPDTNIRAANILANNEEGSNFVIAHISYIDLFQDIVFTRKLLQKNPIPKEIKQHLAKQILEISPANRGFIIHKFDHLQLNANSQIEVIKELLYQMRSSTLSDQIQVAIADIIIEKYPRGPGFLLNNINLFNHTQALADILIEAAPGKAYIINNINKFNLSEEQKNSLLQKCGITPVLV